MRCYDPPMGGVGPGHARDPESIVVAESRSQMAVLFGFLLVLFAAALIRGVTGARPRPGGWPPRCSAPFSSSPSLGLDRGSRRPARLEISRDAVRFMSRKGKASALSRESGDELRFVKQHAGPLSRIWTLGLTIAGTDAVLLLPGFFSRSEVRQACRARGWRVDD